MSNLYNLDGIQTEIRKQIQHDTAILEAWKKVTFPTKKDGSAFKNMSKNISGASYYAQSYALQAGEYKIRVNAWYEMGGYISDEINAHNLVRYVDDAKKAKTNNHMPKQQGLEQVYVYDLEDIKEAIQKRIAYLENRIQNLNKQLEFSEIAYKNFVNAYRAAAEQLASDAKKNDNPTLYHMIMDTVKARYPYC